MSGSKIVMVPDWDESLGMSAIADFEPRRFIRLTSSKVLRSSDATSTSRTMT